MIFVKYAAIEVVIIFDLMLLYGIVPTSNDVFTINERIDMLMKRLQEEQKGAGDIQILDNNSKDNRTANERFENKSKDNVEGTRDVVTLYENTDLDTKTSEPSSKPRAPNQYVETVVYDGDTDSECSDISDTYTKEDFHELYMINNETIDFINNIPSFENPLCHKHSNIKLKSTEFVSDYKKQFLFKNPYIEHQLKNFKVFGSVFPASLTDYKSCKRLDDNYTFYMDNLITYVQFTIEQLKRISNGDYLSDYAKQKWKEVKVIKKKEQKNVKNTELSNSISIPLCTDNKRESNNTICNKFTTHSETNFRFLDKILEKKIILEVPKLIFGSLKLFGQLCNNKLIIQCKKDKKTNDKEYEEESQKIVALDLTHPSLPVMYENLKFTLQTLANTKSKEICKSNLLALEDGNSKNYSTEHEPNLNVEEQDKKLEIISLDSHDESLDETAVSTYDRNKEVDNSCKIDMDLNTDEFKMNAKSYSESVIRLRTDEKFLVAEKLIAESNTCNSDILTSALKRLNTPSVVCEEIEVNNKKKRRSPTRVRIKSPYENKSYIFDEKKRKRLLEIRERRDKKKAAISKHFKMSKNKYGQGAILPQASSSVAKLSITNKSFYNSIYGHTIYTGNKSETKTNSNGKERTKEGFELKNVQSGKKNVGSNSSILSRFQDMDTLSHYTETDHQLRCINDEENTLESTVTESVKKAEYITPTIDVQQNLLSIDQQKISTSEETDNNDINVIQPRYIENVVPVNTPVNLLTHECPKSFSTECRKSIDKLYDLMKELVNSDDLDTVPTKIESMSTSSNNTLNVQKSIDSFVSSSLNEPNMKQHLTSSNQSDCSFEKHLPAISSENNKNKNDEVLNNIPKVVVTSKLQAVKFDEQSIKSNRKHITTKILENPLKAISQLIHKFDDVKRISHKINSEIKAHTKSGALNKEVKNNELRLVPPKTLKLDKPFKNYNHKDNYISKPIDKTSHSVKETLRSPNQQKLSESKNTEKINEKNIKDLIDEVKEMRGEAVKGPNRISRLDSLAKPKKIHSDTFYKECKVNYGRNDSARLHRHTSQIPQRINNRTLQKNDQKKTPDWKRPKINTIQSKTQEATVNDRPSTSNSPERRRSENKKVLHSKINNDANNTFLKRKTVAVESLAKNCCAPVSKNFKDSKIPQKYRLPVILDDADLTSLISSLSEDENASLGNKIHSMVDAVINISPPSLNVLTECTESLSELSKSDNTEAFMTKSKPEVLSGSDFSIDIFEDKNIITAVASTSYSKNINVHTSIANKKQSHLLKSDERTSSSLTELEKLKNVLTGHTISDIFHKKLRVKNLTPKHSVQQIFVLQSGDASSVVVKSTLSEQINISETNTLSKMLSAHTLSKRCINWSYNKLPLRYFPALPYRDRDRNFTQKNYNNFINKIYETSQKKLSKTSQMIQICNDLNKVSCNNKINDNNDESLSLENTNQDRAIWTFDKNAITSNNSKSEIDPENLIDTHVTQTKKRSEDIDNTTSMDILIDLLNEIKKISTYQANIESQGFEIINNEKENIDREDCSKNNSQNQISITTLDKIRVIESNACINSYYISSKRDGANDDRGEYIITSTVNNNGENVLFNKSYVDKEITANTTKKEMIHRCTNVPSQLLPITDSQSSNILFSDATFKHVLPIESIHCDNVCNVVNSKSSSNEALKKVASEFNQEDYLHNLNKTNDKAVLCKEFNSEKDLLPIKKNSQFIEKDTKVNCIKNATEDPLLKLKRDILVTFYSMLVLTVFAALSFPNILH